MEDMQMLTVIEGSARPRFGGRGSDQDLHLSPVLDSRLPSAKHNAKAESAGVGPPSFGEDRHLYYESPATGASRFTNHLHMLSLAIVPEAEYTRRPRNYTPTSQNLGKADAAYPYKFYWRVHYLDIDLLEKNMNLKGSSSKSHNLSLQLIWSIS